MDSNEHKSVGVLVIAGCSVMAARTRNLPPQRGHGSESTSNTPQKRAPCASSCAASGKPTSMADTSVVSSTDGTCRSLGRSCRRPLSSLDLSSLTGAQSRVLYLSLGEVSELLSAHNNALPLKDVATHDSYLVFVEKNRSDVSWGIPLASLDGVDPTVWQRYLRARRTRAKKRTGQYENYTLPPFHPPCGGKGRGWGAQIRAGDGGHKLGPGMGGTNLLCSAHTIRSNSRKTSCLNDPK